MLFEFIIKILSHIKYRALIKYCFFFLKTVIVSLIKSCPRIPNITLKMSRHRDQKTPTQSRQSSPLKLLRGANKGERPLLVCRLSPLWNPLTLSLLPLTLNPFPLNLLRKKRNKRVQRPLLVYRFIKPLCHPLSTLFSPHLLIAPQLSSSSLPSPSALPLHKQM